MFEFVVKEFDKIRVSHKVLDSIESLLDFFLQAEWLGDPLLEHPPAHPTARVVHPVEKRAFFLATHEPLHVQKLELLYGLRIQLHLGVTQCDWVIRVKF